MPNDITRLLIDWGNGDHQALDRLMPLVYDELHRLAERSMWRERKDHTLQPTALVNEAYLQLIDQTRVRWQNRGHFFSVAACLMRRVTMLHVRRQRAQKRGGGIPRVAFDDQLMVPDQRSDSLIAMDDALAELKRIDPQLARLVEIRFFGGLTVAEAAEALGVSATTVKRGWRAARAWLTDRLATERVASAAP